VPHLICVLKGGYQFFADLMNSLRTFRELSARPNMPFTFDFMRVKSYEGTESTGKGVRARRASARARARWARARWARARWARARWARAQQLGLRRAATAV
jgi:hypothetical protein